MPPPKSSARYPLEFRDAAEAALRLGTLSIPVPPGKSAISMQMQIAAYFRALEREGNPEFANTLVVRLSPDRASVLIQDRGISPVAAAIREALGKTEAQTGLDSLLESQP